MEEHNDKVKTPEEESKEIDYVSTASASGSVSPKDPLKEELRSDQEQQIMNFEQYIQMLE
jgi:hypothetical protein